MIVFFSALTSVILFWDHSTSCEITGMGALTITQNLGCQSLAVAANIFMGQTEAPLLIKGYLKRMTRSSCSGHGGWNGNSSRKCNGCLHQFLGGNDPEQQLIMLKIY